MHVLLTNDDGIESTGLQVLYDALDDSGEVTVVAP
ncbi:MAG: 5'/3'-nucleotidase SurE, partial [Halobacteriales archaeon SW_9_67_24]